jgi:hypothetical protein
LSLASSLSAPSCSAPSSKKPCGAWQNQLSCCGHKYTSWWFIAFAWQGKWWCANTALGILPAGFDCFNNRMNLFPTFTHTVHVIDGSLPEKHNPLHVFTFFLSF